MNKLVEEFKPPKGWRLNRGKCPKEALGKRVRVILRHSQEEPRYGNETRPDVAPGWAADGRFGCRWTMDDRRFPRGFDILAYKIL